MATMLVGYDLNAPGKDYAKLHEYLKGLGAWWHHLDSTWLIRTNLTPVEIRDGAASFLDPNDELLVIDVSEDARAWRGFSTSGSKWLKERFS